MTTATKTYTMTKDQAVRILAGMMCAAEIAGHKGSLVDLYPLYSEANVIADAAYECLNTWLAAQPKPLYYLTVWDYVKGVTDGNIALYLSIAEDENA